MDRINTGVPGLDAVMGGGFVSTDLCVIAGPAGSGKTIFGCQFMYESVRSGESGVYISFEEDPAQIKRDMLELGWDFTEYESRGKMSFAKYDPFHIDELFGQIENQIRSINATRVVIDSVTGLTLTLGTEAEKRLTIYKLGRILKRLGCTTLVLSENPPAQKGALAEFNVEEFVADDVIILYYLSKGSDFKRALTVWKTRGSIHSQKVHPYKITESGLVVYPDEEISLGD